MGVNTNDNHSFSLRPKYAVQINQPKFSQSLSERLILKVTIINKFLNLEVCQMVLSVDVPIATSINIVNNIYNII